MSRDLLSYLDDMPCGSVSSASEYDYLGHFRELEYLDQGHNDLRMAQQIESGDIPDIRGGSNTPADAEPGAYSGTNELSQGQSAGSGGSSSTNSSRPGSGPASSALKSAFGVGDSSGGPASAVARRVIGTPNTDSDFKSEGGGILGALTGGGF